jgi:hypothetical protein
MYPRVASAYDQNPARILSIVRENRRKPTGDKGLKLGLLVTMAAGIALVAKHMGLGA